MKLSTCTDKCLNDSAQCFDMVGMGDRVDHFHVVKGEQARNQLVDALRDIWPRPEEITEDVDFSDFRGDWIAQAAILALDRVKR